MIFVLRLENQPIKLLDFMFRAWFLCSEHLAKFYAFKARMLNCIDFLLMKNKFDIFAMIYIREIFYSQMSRKINREWKLVGLLYSNVWLSLVSEHPVKVFIIEQLHASILKILEHMLKNKTSSETSTLL